MSGVEMVESPYAFGIDLGTTNSAISVFAENQAQIIKIEGADSMPSAVFFGEDKILVGARARSYAIVDPDNTVLSIKSQLGTDWTKSYNGKTFTPTDISERILRKLRETIDPAHDLKGMPTRVVICVPANFDDNKKAATRQAAEQAGFEVLDLLEEPVAAAVAYAFDKERKQAILVYDLGGGTLDVTVLQVDSTETEEATLKVLGVAGIPHLGGDDFDNAIMRLIAADLQAKSNIDLYDEVKDQEISPTDLRKARTKLKQYAEDAKKQLTSSDTTEILITDLIIDGNGQSHSVEMEITRAQFEAAIVDAVEKSRATLEEALSKAGKTMDDITRVILVGGSTKIPLIRERLKEWCRREPYADLDPATVVARGAAIWGAAKFGSGEIDKRPVKRIEVFNKVNHFLGVETVRGEIDWLLKEGTDIPPDAPLEVTSQYTTSADDQDEIEVRILQATTEAKDVTGEGVIRIGELKIVELPRRPKGQIVAELTFSINQSNVLTVKAECEGKTVNVSIDRNKN